LWPERLLVSLEPHALAALRLSGGPRPRVLARSRVEVEMRADPDYGAQPWHGVLETLKREAQAWRSVRARVEVVLSNHFVRYAIVAPQGGAASGDEELALARFQFAKVHGERARTWEVRVSREAGAAQLACAVDAELLAALKGCFAGGRARLDSVQPHLMSAFNRWRGRIPKEGAWLALGEPGRVCLALVAARGWRALHNGPGHAAVAQDWGELIERERRRASGEVLPRMVLVRPAARPDLLPLDDEPQAMTLAAA
jgi:hypothetical protein